MGYIPEETATYTSYHINTVRSKTREHWWPLIITNRGAINITPPLTLIGSTNDRSHFSAVISYI